MREKFPPHGANLSWAEARYGIDRERFLDFSSNVNPLGPPASALEAARKALENVSRYPEPQGDSLRKALARHLGRDEGQLMLGNGATELIHLLCQRLRPSRALVVAPAFGEYQRAATAAGAELEFFFLRPEDGFRFQPRELAEAAYGMNLIFFCNPASPTGALYTQEEIEPLLQACRRWGGILAVDESFMGFASEGEIERASLIAETEGGNLVIISTLTKLYALAGLRGPGFLVADDKMISLVEGWALPWRVNVVAQAAAMAALEDRDYLERTRQRIAEWREKLRVGLEELGCLELFPSSANYLLAKVKEGKMDAGELVDALGYRSILVRYAGNFQGLDSSFFRVAVRLPQENDILLKNLREVIRC